MASVKQKVGDIEARMQHLAYKEEVKRHKAFADECERVRNAPKTCTWFDTPPLLVAITGKSKWFAKVGYLKKVGNVFGLVEIPGVHGEHWIKLEKMRYADSSKSARPVSRADFQQERAGSGGEVGPVA